MKICKPNHAFRQVIAITILFLFMTGKSNSQIPSTDIFVLSMKTTQEGTFSFSNPVNITNRVGYDNQPVFAPDGKIYYTSRRDSSGTDIFMYDPANNKTIRITKTPESEYSPTLMPGNKALSVVRVDMDSAQRLYQVTLDGKKSRLIIKGQDSVGYHSWIDNNRVALYLLGDSATLIIFDLTTQKAETVAKNIGRCIAVIPGTKQVSFVEKVSPTEWFIKAWNPETNKISFLMKTLEGSEDYAWTKDKKLLTGQDGKLFMSAPFLGTNWKEISSFTNTVGPFYRIAVSPDGTKVALVNYQGAKP